MVAIGTVFSREFPIAFISVRRSATQHFQALIGLVYYHVDDFGGFAQKFGQRQHIFIQAAKQKAFVAFKARHFFQVVRAFVVETIRITCFAWVFDFQQFA